MDFFGVETFSPSYLSKCCGFTNILTVLKISLKNGLYDRILAVCATYKPCPLNKSMSIKCIWGPGNLIKVKFNPIGMA